MKFQIKSKYKARVIFEAEVGSLKLCVELAVKSKIDLRGAYLRGADLRDAYLGGAYLRDAYLGGADLRDADLGGAYLRGAYLRGADLRDADLRGADLRDAYLGGAYLRDADLGGADLRDADLRGAKIDDLMCITDLQDAIDLAPMIFDEWLKNSFESAQKRFGMYAVAGEKRALILICPLFPGGYCFVLEKREIWWWSWSCPNSENVPILWRESK